MLSSSSFYYYWYDHGKGGGGVDFEGNIVFRNGSEVALSDKNLDIVDTFLQGVDVQANYILYNCIFSVDTSTLYFSDDKGLTINQAPNLVASGLSCVYPLGREIYVAGSDGFHKAEVDVWSWTDISTVLNITDLNFCAPNLLASTTDTASLVYSTDNGSTWNNATVPAGVDGCSAISITAGKVYASIQKTDVPLVAPRLLVSLDMGQTYSYLSSDLVTTDSTDFFGKVYEFSGGRIIYATSIGIYVAESGSDFILKINSAANGIAKFENRVYISTVSDGIYYTDDQGVTFTNFLVSSSAISADDNCYVVQNPGGILIIDDANYNQFVIQSVAEPIAYLTDDSGNILTDDPLTNQLTP